MSDMISEYTQRWSAFKPIYYYGIAFWSHFMEGGLSCVAEIDEVLFGSESLSGFLVLMKQSDRCIDLGWIQKEISQ